MKFIIRVFIIVLLIFPTKNILAIEKNDYEINIESWNYNIELAKKYMIEAQQALDEGDVLLSCTNQLKASELGAKATRSRIRAAEIEGKKEELPNLENGLKKWKEFGEFCS